MRSFKRSFSSRALRHRLDGLELLAPHDIEVAEDALRLGAHDAFDLLADAFGGARGVGDELAELVKKPACRLRHRFHPCSSAELWGCRALPQAGGRADFRALTGERLAVKARPGPPRNFGSPMQLLVLPYPVIDPVAIAIGPLAIRWYGLAYMAGILLGWLYGRYLVSRPISGAASPR